VRLHLRIPGDRLSVVAGRHHLRAPFEVTPRNETYRRFEPVDDDGKGNDTSVPRSCLDDPRWIRVGAGSTASMTRAP
jgi:hypothetical protein